MNDVTALVEGIDAALKKHTAWKSRLMSAMHRGQSDITPNEAACDHACEFGRWFHGPTIPASVRRSSAYLTIGRLHADFHGCAAQVLMLATTGRQDAAKTLLFGTFEARSDTLMRALQAWRHDLLQLQRKAGPNGKGRPGLGSPAPLLPRRSAIADPFPPRRR